MITIKGIIKKGRQRARMLGFPTANVQVSDQIESGVYTGKVSLQDEKYPALIFKSVKNNFIEVHIPGFSGNIYGFEIETRIEKKLRDEKEFHTDQELITQIRKDLCSLA